MWGRFRWSEGTWAEGPPINPNSVTITETVATGDSYSSILNAVAARTETVATADSYASIGAFGVSLTEAITVTDEYGATIEITAELAESLGLGDLYEGVIGGIVPVQQLREFVAVALNMARNGTAVRADRVASMIGRGKGGQGVF